QIRDDFQFALFIEVAKPSMADIQDRAISARIFIWSFARVEIFGGEPLAAPWALQATPLQCSRSADSRYAVPPRPIHLWLRLHRAVTLCESCLRLRARLIPQ